MKKKLMSILIMLAMIITCIPISASADTEPAQKSKEEYVKMYSDVCNAFFNEIITKDANDHKLPIIANSIYPTDEMQLDIVFSSQREIFDKIYAEYKEDLPEQLFFSIYPIRDESPETDGESVENEGGNEVDFTNLIFELSINLQQKDEDGNFIYDEDGSPTMEQVIMRSETVTVEYALAGEDSNKSYEILGFINDKIVENTEYRITDMELINYWYNMSHTEKFLPLINYSSELKDDLDNYNFYFNVSVGDEPSYYTFEGGQGAIVYNGGFYGFTPNISAKGEHIIHVDSEVTSENLADAALERIKGYLGEKVYNASSINISPNYDDNGKNITVDSVYNEMEASYRNSVEETVNDINETIAEFKKCYNEAVAQNDSEEAERWESFIEEAEQIIVATNASLKNYLNTIGFLEAIKEDHSNLPTFTLQINNITRNIIIVPDGELPDPSLLTKDFTTNIEISTDSTEVPLDSLIEAEQKDEFEDILKEEKGVTEDNSLTYDLKVYSKTLAHDKSNSKNGYITELENGEFEVVVPIKDTTLEGKKLIAYYVYTDGPGNSGNEQIEEHEVTVEKGYAKFKTDHFSEYTLAPVSDADGTGAGTGTTTTPDSSVNTGDDFSAIPYIAVMVIALACVAVALFRRKTVK